ncbi:MAG: hypothetical protein JW830_06925 [Bacteroidales bacterium]|nr:hypothetical protein [Bacteroidales bacterium]
MSQLIVIRELLNIFQGNELIIGMILAIWMLHTALGSKLGKGLTGKSGNRKMIARMFSLAGILPALTIILLYVLETHLFPPGTTKGFITTFLFCFFLLLPFCIISGMLFTLLATAISLASEQNKISEAYGWESLGSLAAGILFSLLLSRWLGTFQLLALIILINLTIYMLLMCSVKPYWKILLIPVIWTTLALFLIVTPAEKRIKSLHFKNQDLIYTKDTPYGNVSVTNTAGQFNFYENGGLSFTTENRIMPEEAIHFTLLQLKKPEHILIVSGGKNGMAGEVLKYPSIQHIDYFEINPWLIQAENRFSDPLHSDKLNVVSKDARRWISKSASKYDAIIVNTHDPSNAQVNRYYTLEFFAETKNALRRNGVLSVSLSPTANYMSAGAKEINSVIYQTLKKVFQRVVVIPGERNYFLASDNELHLNISKRVVASGIETEYVNPGYIDDDLLKQNSQLIMHEISGESARINQDLTPLAYFLQINYWLSIWQAKVWVIIILVLLLLLILVLSKSISAVGAGIFAGGFAGASAEFLVIIVYQILYGYVYQMLGIIIAFYMTGLAAGAIMGIRSGTGVSYRSYIFLQIILLQMVIFLPFLILFLSRFSNMPEWTGQTFLLIITGLIALVTGLEFNIASRLEKQKIENIAGNLYGIDLAGAASGTLLVSLVCFPVMGLFNTCLLIAGLILSGILVMAIYGKKYS